MMNHYFDSKFLGHATANDLHLKFKEVTSKLDCKRLIHVSMDGPRVNLKLKSSIRILSLSALLLTHACLFYLILEYVLYMLCTVPLKPGSKRRIGKLIRF